MNYNRLGFIANIMRVLLFFLKILSLLPFCVLYVLSDIMAAVVYHVVRYRRKLVRKNLTSSFPNKSLKEVKQIERRYYRFLCDVMVETIKLLSLSDVGLKKRVKVINPDIVNASVSNGKSAVILLGHYGNWEWVQEIATYFSDKAFKGSIYHEMKNNLSDRLFLHIRNRWGMHIVPQNKAIRTLLNKDNQPWIFGFIADQRPKYISADNRVMFLNHETAFITGPEDRGNKVGADFFYLDIQRYRRGYYNLKFIPITAVETDGVKYSILRSFWSKFEESILQNPALWLWSHNRWKKLREKS